jgi:hypothetical protein
MKGVLPWLVLWACRAGTRYFCFALDALVAQNNNICFFTIISIPLAPKTGQTAVLGRLSLGMCLWFPVYFPAYQL